MTVVGPAGASTWVSAASVADRGDSGGTAAEVSDATGLVADAGDVAGVGSAVLDEPEQAPTSSPQVVTMAARPVVLWRKCMRTA